jgi:hypothetical protein
MDDVLIEFAWEHVNLHFGVFFCKMIGRATAPSAKPLLQFWIPSDLACCPLHFLRRFARFCVPLLEDRSINSAPRLLATNAASMCFSVCRVEQSEFHRPKLQPS